MADAFLITFEKMMEILGLLTLGFLFNKLKLIPRTAEHVLSRFVTMLFLPCLSLYAGIMECKVTALGDYVVLVLVGGAFCLFSILLAYPMSGLFQKEKGYTRNIYRYALAIPNTGGVATPLMMALFGTAGVFQHGMFTFVHSLMTSSWGLAQLVPSKDKPSVWSNLKKAVFNLPFMAKVFGIVLGLLGAKEWLPGPVLNVCSDLGDTYIIVALLMTGFTLADYPFANIFGNLKTYTFTAWRLLIAPCLFLLILLVCKAPLMMAVMLTVTYGGPCGMNVVIFPAAYGEKCPADGAGMVLISTLLSTVTVPLVYALVQIFFT